MKQKISDTALIFLKGLLMGASDIVPGVSGGTIAFITGIYQRLIDGVKNATDFVRPLATGEFTKARKKIVEIDFPFFIPLGIGIAIAFAAGSHIIPYLIDTKPAFIFSFFFGLILASIFIVYKKIDKASAAGIFWGIIGFAIAFFLVDLQSVNANHSLPVIFLSGFIAISAMLLPGISGSFILLMMGQYRYMLDSLKNLSTEYMTVLSFALGAILGLAAFSRIMAYLLKKHNSSTMIFLVGLMLGALRVPYNEIFNVTRLHPELGFSWTFIGGLIAFALAVVGAVIVIFIGKYDPKNSKS